MHASHDLSFAGSPKHNSRLGSEASRPQLGKIFVTLWITSVAIALMWTLAAAPAIAAVLPTDLEAKIDAGYQPADADERAIWQNLEALEEALQTSPQRLIAPQLEAFTHGVVERLIGRPAPELRIYLMRDASFNAAMLPSGMMIVNTGVLARVRDEAQFAAVLGHEAAHYLRRHSLDRFHEVRRKVALVEKANASAQGGVYNWSLLSQAILMSVFKFSRDQELEADAFGMLMLARAGYPPRAASTMCAQLLDERRASAAGRHRRYRDPASFGLSTHPPTQARIIDLADTADFLAGRVEVEQGARRDDWKSVIEPHLAMLLREQIYLNDPGASLYLLEGLAKDGWTGLLRFNEGEVYRLRNEDGDDLRAATAYAAATGLPDAPPEAWRARGYALLRGGSRIEAQAALNRYLAMRPQAPDAAMVSFTLSQ